MNHVSDPSNDAIVAYLSHADERCPKCDYELKGNSSNRCPECGTSVEMHLGTHVGGEAWWWTAVLGVGTAAMPIVGYFIVRLYVIASLLDSLFLTGMSSQSRDLIPQMLNLRVGFTLAIFASGLLMALAWLIGGRVSWRFLSRRRQRTLGLLGGMMPVIMLGVIVLYAIVIY